jgi:hypothetical protein
METDMATTRTVEGHTPSGGVRTTLYFLNDRRELVDEKDATAVDIVEFDDQGEGVSRIYALLGDREDSSTESP